MWRGAMFYWNMHRVIYRKQFVSAACINQWLEEEKAVSLAFAQKGPAAELLQRASL